MVKIVNINAFSSIKIINKSVIRFIILLLGIAVLVVFHLAINPLCRPETSIRNYILRLTPLGTDIEEVILILENRDELEVRYINYSNGYIYQGSPIASWPTNEYGMSVIGDKSIKVEGSYRAIYKLFLESVVDVCYGFDVDGKLVEVTVSKYIAI